MSRRMWTAVETKVGKIGIAKTKERRGKRGGKKETGGERVKEKELEKEKDNRYKESSRGMEDLG